MTKHIKMGKAGLVFVAVIVCFIGSVCGVNNPLPVEKCSFGDSKCMEKEFQAGLTTFIAGLPEFGTDVLDVMDLDDLAFDLAGLQFTLKNGKLKGLKNIVIDKVKWDLSKNRLEVKWHVDCVVRGHYTAGGRVLILPITGDGKIKLTMKNLQVKFVLDFDKKPGEDDKDYIIPKKYTFDFDVIDNTRFELSNLFNGNKELSQAMLRFLNDNWKDVSKEFGRPIIDVAAKKIFKNVVKYLSAMPVEDIVNV